MRVLRGPGSYCASNGALCAAGHGMSTTNMPQLVQHLQKLADVHVHDTMDAIELDVSNVADINCVDELLCDALFADPLDREPARYGWRIHLAKRNGLRGAGDMQVLPENGTMRYVPMRA